MPDWNGINAALIDSGVDVRPDEAPQPVAGGDISSAWPLETADGAVFLKTGPASSYDMFAAEAEGLAALAAPQAVRVPAVFACDISAGTAFVALEWLNFSAPSRDTEARLGEQLAALHRSTAERFGWHRDNTIGLTPQHNDWSDDWIGFFRERRLGFQLQLAAQNGFGGELQTQGAQLMKRLPVYFEGYAPEPSLLHGDLWGGNWASCGGEPVIFDPAVYYGDRAAGRRSSRAQSPLPAVSRPQSPEPVRQRLSRTGPGPHATTVTRMIMLRNYLFLLCAAAAFAACAEPDTTDLAAERGATLLAPFKSELKGALMAGMQQGPPAAIEVCRGKAPAIAAELSVDGVRMGRSSHKLRNTDNAAPEWLAPIIERWADGEVRADESTVSVYAVMDLGGDRHGYAEAIFVQPVCLTCHGDTLAADVAATIAEFYPDDEATGFSAGDFRGVFWVEF